MNPIAALIASGIVTAVAAQTVHCDIPAPCLGASVDTKGTVSGNITVNSSRSLATVTVQYGLNPVNKYSNAQRGMHVVAVDRDAGMILNSKAFDTYASTIKADDLVSFINSIPSGQILCFAIRDEAVNNLYNRSIFKDLGSQYIDEIGYRSFWNFVVVKGGEVIGETYVLNADPMNTWPAPLTLSVTFQLPVTIPYNLVVQEVSTSSATLQWKIPLYHPAVILTYIVTYYQTDNITSAKEAYAPGRTTSLVIGGLSSGMSYTFTVRAMTQEGESGYSAPVNATTLKEGSASSIIIPLVCALAAAFVLILITVVAVIVLMVLLLRRRGRRSKTPDRACSDQRNEMRGIDMDDNAAYEVVRDPEYYI